MTFPKRILFLVTKQANERYEPYKSATTPLRTARRPVAGAMRISAAPRDTATRGAVPVGEVLADLPPEAAAPAEAAAPEPARAPDEAAEPEPDPEPDEPDEPDEADAREPEAPVAVAEAAEPESWAPEAAAPVTTGRREVGAGPVWARSPTSPVAATPPPVAVRVGALYEASLLVSLVKGCAVLVTRLTLTTGCKSGAHAKGSIGTGVVLVRTRLAERLPVAQLGGILVAIVGVASTAVVDVLEVAGRA
jgi:pyruvate/2-oxoglutarate dehydrogenase complex dihydrolipoamide acyltransferase (E2) component